MVVASVIRYMLSHELNDMPEYSFTAWDRYVLLVPTMDANFSCVRSFCLYSLSV